MHSTDTWTYISTWTLHTFPYLCNYGKCMLYMLKNLNVLKKKKEIWIAVKPLALENPQAIWGCNYWQLRRMEWRISRSPSTAPQTHPNLQLSNPQENNTLEDNKKPLYNHLVFSIKYDSFSRIVWFKSHLLKLFLSNA